MKWQKNAYIFHVNIHNFLYLNIWQETETIKSDNYWRESHRRSYFHKLDKIDNDMNRV